jgi:hypothetical protein
VDGTPAIARGLMPSPPGNQEIYVEFISLGNVVKATAIHAQSGVEASVVGPVSAPRVSLEQAAVRKLEYVLKKQSR